MSTRGKNKDDDEDNDVWSTADSLTLASIVQRMGERNWVFISRSLKLHGRSSHDLYTPKKCAVQYHKLFKGVEEDQKKSKRNEKERRFLEDLLVKKLHDQRMQELQSFQNECETLCRSFAQLNELIDSGCFDDGDNLECLASEVKKFRDAWPDFSSNDCAWSLPVDPTAALKVATSPLAAKGKLTAVGSEENPSTSKSVADQHIPGPEIKQATPAPVAIKTSPPPPQSFFSPNSALATAAARQLVAATTPIPASMPKPPDISGPFCATVPKLITATATSVTLSAPTLSKLLEMPPSIPGKLPPLPTALYSTPILPVKMPQQIQTVKETKVVEHKGDSWQAKPQISSKPILEREVARESIDPTLIRMAAISNIVLPENNSQTKLVEAKPPNIVEPERDEDNNSATDTEMLSSESSSRNSSSDNTEQSCGTNSPLHTKVVKQQKRKRSLNEQSIKGISQSPDDSRDPFEHSDSKTLLEDIRTLPDSNTSSADASLDGDKEKNPVDKTYSMGISTVEDITEDTVLNEVGGSCNATGSTFDTGRTTFSTVGSTTFGSVGRTTFGVVESAFDSAGSAPFITVGGTPFNVAPRMGRPSFSVKAAAAFDSVDDTFVFNENEECHAIAAKSKPLGLERPLYGLVKGGSDKGSKVSALKESLLKLREVADSSNDKSILQGLSNSTNSCSPSSNNCIISPKKLDSLKHAQLNDKESDLLPKKPFVRKSDKAGEDLLVSPKEVQNSGISLQDLPSCTQNNKTSSPGLILDSLKQFAVASGVGEDSDKLTSSGTSSSEHSSSETLSISSSSQDSDTKNDEKSPASPNSKTTFSGSPKKGRGASKGSSPSPTKTRNAARGSGSPGRSRGSSRASQSPRKHKTSAASKALSAVGESLLQHSDHLTSPKSTNSISSASEGDNSEGLSYDSELAKSDSSPNIVRPFSTMNSAHGESATSQDFKSPDVKEDSSEPVKKGEINEELLEQSKESSEKICNSSTDRLIQQGSQILSSLPPHETVNKKQIISRRGRRCGRTTPKNSSNNDGDVTHSSLDFMRDVEVTLEPLSEANVCFMHEKMRDKAEREKRETLDATKAESKNSPKPSRAAARRGRRGRSKNTSTAESIKVEEQKQKEDSSGEDDSSCKGMDADEQSVKSEPKDSDESSDAGNSCPKPDWEDDDIDISVDKKEDEDLTENLKTDDKISDDQSSSASSTPSSPSSPSSPGSGISDEKDALDNNQWNSDFDAQNVASTSTSDSSGDSSDDSDESLPASNSSDSTASEKTMPKAKRLKKDHDAQHQYKRWKKSICMIWREASYHKFANVFSQKVTNDVAPGYESIVYRPLDLSLIKKNIDNCTITTTEEFERDMMLMFQNAIMYNGSDHDVHKMAVEMQRDVFKLIQDYIATQQVIEEKVEPPAVQPSLRAGRRAKSVSKGQRSSTSKTSKE